MGNIFTIDVPIQSNEPGDSILSSYYRDVQIATEQKDIKVKIAALERNLTILPQYVRVTLARDRSLPPIIPCRDYLPDYYGRFGMWEKAERALNICIESNAFYPNKGTRSLSDLKKARKASEKALEYIRNNPGVLQKNIYKELKPLKLDDYYLKHFIKCSQQIRKVPEAGTYKLYAE